MIKKITGLLFIGLSYQLAAQPQLKFTETKQNFGFVKNGQPVKLTYHFTNIGNQPLFVRDGVATCSCTEVIWPKEPILPSKEGDIEILFDTAPAHGRQDRTVEIHTNEENSPQKIRFKGVVLK
jgi:hypothetical protein